MSLQKKADEYFSSLNPIATRISRDIQDTKSSYENLWQTLSYEEQQDILNQSIVKPEVALRYLTDDKVEDDIKPAFATKIITDDNYTYRDEHSAPFSYITGSQRDLRIFSTGEVSVVKKSPKKMSPVKPEAAPIRNHVEKQKEIVCVVDEGVDEVDELNLLPKTGLDLLDNW